MADAWFENVQMLAAPGFTGGYTVRRTMCASEEGAAEALRLVRQFAPGAKLDPVEPGPGPWCTDKPIRSILLPNGERMNAGLVLAHYYRDRGSASAASDSDLAAEVRTLLGTTPGV